MKFSLNKLVIAAALVVPAMAMASSPAAGMIGGRHDFASDTSKILASQVELKDSKGNVVIAATIANQVGLCSFCHTPHSASSTSLLWNRSEPIHDYSWNETKTTGGTQLGFTKTFNGPSVKCLSCHDGSVTMGDVGNYMESTRHNAFSLNTYKVGDNDPAVAGDNTKVTKKVGNTAGVISGSHPVGIPYPYNQAASTYNGQGVGSEVVKTEFVAMPTKSAAGTSGVKLYTNTGTAVTAGATEGSTGMECSSCHDVHNKQTVDDVMLRGKIAGSAAGDGYICAQCHIKDH